MSSNLLSKNMQKHIHDEVDLDFRIYLLEVSPLLKIEGLVEAAT